MGAHAWFLWIDSFCSLAIFKSYRPSSQFKYHVVLAHRYAGTYSWCSDGGFRARLGVQGSHTKGLLDVAVKTSYHHDPGLCAGGPVGCINSRYFKGGSVFGASVVIILSCAGSIDRLPSASQPKGLNKA